MTRTLLETLVRHAAALAAEAGGSDAELLRRFTAERDEAAFAELVRRHGPMVWAVCRHLLPNSTDADDAFQATFLALVRSASRVRSGASVGGWLHGVAVRVATKAKRSAVRRRQREHRAAGPEAGQPVADAAWDGLLAAVHEEVQRLPETQRTAFVLCDLEGVPQPAAAERLNWKLGTLSGRLCQARQTLLKRLAGRGFAPAVGVVGVGAASAGAGVPPGLMVKVLAYLSATNDVPTAILELLKEATPMTFSRTKLLAAAVLVAGGLATGVGARFLTTAEAQVPGGSGLPALGGAGGRGGGFGEGAAAGGPAAGGMPGGSGGLSASPTGPRWDYRYEDKPGDKAEFIKLVNALGKQGWEFASVVVPEPGTSTLPFIVFKRPIPTPSPPIGTTGFRGAAGSSGGVASIEAMAEMQFARLVQQSGGTNEIVLEKLSANDRDAFNQTLIRQGSTMRFPEKGTFARAEFLKWYIDISESSIRNNRAKAGSGMAPIPIASDPPAIAPKPPAAAKHDILVLRMKYATANTVAQQVSNVFNGDNPTRFRVISDTATNSLILYGTADDFVLVKRVVEVLDVPEARAKP